MEINLHLHLGAVGRPPPARPSARIEEAGPETSAATENETAVAFENVRALNSALREAPVSRAEMVKRGAELVGDVNYPPRETIDKISHLLAMRLYADDASSAAPED